MRRIVPVRRACARGCGIWRVDGVLHEWQVEHNPGTSIQRRRGRLGGLLAMAQTGAREASIGGVAVGRGIHQGSRIRSRGLRQAASQRHLRLQQQHGQQHAQTHRAPGGTGGESQAHGQSHAHHYSRLSGSAEARCCRQPGDVRVDPVELITQHNKMDPTMAFKKPVGQLLDFFSDLSEQAAALRGLPFSTGAFSHRGPVHGTGSAV
jgi:hypothetical protein